MIAVSVTIYVTLHLETASLCTTDKTTAKTKNPKMFDYVKKLEISC